MEGVRMSDVTIDETQAVSLVDPLHSPTTKMAIALAANRDQRGLHVYAGTVPTKTIDKRRKANKAAGIARRATR
jgi:hypothetical protein